MKINKGKTHEKKYLVGSWAFLELVCTEVLSCSRISTFKKEFTQNIFFRG